METEVVISSLKQFSIFSIKVICILILLIIARFNGDYEYISIIERGSQKVLTFDLSYYSLEFFYKCYPVLICYYTVLHQLPIFIMPRYTCTRASILCSHILIQVSSSSFALISLSTSIVVQLMPWAQPDISLGGWGQRHQNRIPLGEGVTIIGFHKASNNCEDSILISISNKARFVLQCFSILLTQGGYANG